MGGSSYIPLPKYLADKKAIINLNINDDQCFKWAVTRAIHPVDKNAQRIDKNLKAKAESLNWDRITFPTPLKDVDKFEKNNQNVSVNVAGFAEKGSCRDAAYEHKVYPLRKSQCNREHKVDLLLFSGKNKEDSESQHYCVIKNMSRLFQGQRTKNKVQQYYC